MLYNIKNIPQVYLQKVASFFSKRINCFVTIEASICLTIAIIATTFMLGPLFILHSCTDIIAKTDSASRLLCYYDIIMENSIRKDKNIEHLDIELLKDTSFEFLNKINIPPTILGNLSLFASIDAQNICLNSVSDINSIFYDESHIVNYDLRFIGKHPLNIWNLKNPEFRIINQRRAFVGIKGNRWADNEKINEMVYNVGDESEVYHLSLSCTYLKKNISSCKILEINNHKNYNGSAYTPCSSCIKNIDGTSEKIVYFTKYGMHFHSKDNCSRLEPLLIRQMSLDTAVEKGLRPCSKCQKNNEE